MLFCTRQSCQETAGLSGTTNRECVPCSFEHPLGMFMMYRDRQGIIV